MIALLIVISVFVLWCLLGFLTHVVLTGTSWGISLLHRLHIARQPLCPVCHVEREETSPVESPNALEVWSAADRIAGIVRGQLGRSGARALDEQMLTKTPPTSDGGRSMKTSTPGGFRLGGPSIRQRIIPESPTSSTSNKGESLGLFVDTSDILMPPFKEEIPEDLDTD